MSASNDPAFDRSQPPAVTASGGFRFPDFLDQRLENGLRVFVARYPRGPLVHQLLVLPGGAQHDPCDLAGLSALTASMIDEGTAERSAIEVAYEVERLGGYLTSQADWDSMSAALGILAKEQQRGLDLLAEVVCTASFPEEELARLREQHLAELQRRSARPAAQASDALAQLVYGKTAYGNPLLGMANTVRIIKRQDILSTAEQQITPAGAALILVGDLDPDRSLEMATAAFRDWMGPDIPPPPAIEPPVAEQHQIVLIDRPQAAQAELWLGHVGVPLDHPDRPGLGVLNSLLGGKFTSRINLNLRERLGITYGASSSFSQRRAAGPFVVAASVDSEAVGKAIREVLWELQRLRDEPVTAAELADTQSYLQGIFPFTLQRIEGLADRLADLAVYGLPRDYFTDYFARVATVTIADLQDLARKHLHPDRLAIVAVGPRTILEDQLTPFGEPRIRPFSGPTESSDKDT
jgi:zinc protease